MLFERRFHAGLRDGSITLTFRAWATPQAKAGGRYVSQIGMLEVDAVDRVELGAIRAVDARRAGFEDREELAAYLNKGLAKAGRKPLRANSLVDRVRLRYAGPAKASDRPRTDVRDLSAEDLDRLVAKLDAMDGRSTKGAWTRRVLALIAKHPRVSAAQLAERLGYDRVAFKADVRKLKKLGLTLSHEVGYEISPRGRAVLAARRPRQG